jgi:hypothetical protein
VRETVHEGQFGTPKTKSSKRDVPMSKPVKEAFLAERKIGAESAADELVFNPRWYTSQSEKSTSKSVAPCVRETGSAGYRLAQFPPHACDPAWRSRRVASHGAGDSRVLGP